MNRGDSKKDQEDETKLLNLIRAPLPLYLKGTLGEKKRFTASTLVK